MAEQSIFHKPFTLWNVTLYINAVQYNLVFDGSKYIRSKINRKCNIIDEYDIFYELYVRVKWSKCCCVFGHRFSVLACWDVISNKDPFC